jgi:hemerythrin-like domain-containing protein
MQNERRQFLIAGGAWGAAVAAVSLPCPALADKPDPVRDEAEADVSATEDLMREHGVLNRILLIYEAGLRRLRDKEDVSPEVFRRSADLVRRFVEDYHEKLEETFLFPEFERAAKLIDLVRTLREQHEAGRRVTDVILRNATSDRFGRSESRRELTHACEAFIRMYRPHEAREDTVLFPALHRIVSAKKLAELGERFEEQEDRLFGDEGFAKNVAQVADIEKQLGIDNLQSFTPG